jgi:hypothetical protein
MAKSSDTLMTFSKNNNGGLIIFHDVIPSQTECGDLIFAGNRTKVMVTPYEGSKAYVATTIVKENDVRGQGGEGDDVHLDYCRLP